MTFASPPTTNPEKSIILPSVFPSGVGSIASLTLRSLLEEITVAEDVEEVGGVSGVVEGVVLSAGEIDSGHVEGEFQEIRLSNPMCASNSFWKSVHSVSIRPCSSSESLVFF